MIPKEILPLLLIVGAIAIQASFVPTQSFDSNDSDLDELMCTNEADGTLLPLTDDCEAYVYCLSGISLKIPCISGMGFSTVRGGCVDYAKSNCVPQSQEDVKPTTKGTCDNEQRPENQAACAGQAYGALVPYPGDCSKFLVCMCEYPTVKDCAAGTWWDNSLKTCNYPQYVDCPWSGTGGSSSTPGITTASTPPTTDGGWGLNCVAYPGMSADVCVDYVNGYLLRYPYNCNVYLNCTMGCPVMTDCPVDKVFNDLLKICDTPETAQCEELPLPSPTTTSTSIPTTTPIAPETTTEEPDINTTLDWGNNCEAPPGMQSDICWELKNGVLMSYPYDCNVYINCTKGCPVMDYCPADKVFNPILLICDTPETANCVELPMPTTTTPVMSTHTTELSTTTTEVSTTTTEEITSTTEVSTTTTEEDVTTTPGICIHPPGILENYCDDLVEGSVLVYPYNCSAYISCRHNCPYLEYCEESKLFNSLLGICDDANNVECQEQPYPTPSTPGATTTPELSTTPQPPFTPTLPPSVDQEMCRDEPDYTVFPYEGNCGQYLVCLDSKVELMDCPNGWLFNAQMKMCDEAGEEVCYTESTTTPEPTTTSTTTTSEPILDLCLGQPSGTSFPYPENCQKYYYCRNNGTYYVLNCPYNNYYDPISGNCGPDISPTACQEALTTTTVAPTEPTTLSPEQKCAGQEFGTTFPYEANCKQYIMCTNNGAYKILNCPGNNYYYPDTGNCGPSDNVDICRGTTTTSTTTTTTTTTTPKPTTTTTSPSSPISQGICGNYTQGELIEYPDNCHKYISCVRPIPIGFYCPGNLYFNVEEQKCALEAAEGSDCSSYPSNETTVAPPTHICQGMSEGDTQIYPADCQMYYQCLGNGYYMLQMCTQGEYFNPLTQQCSHDVGPNYCKQNFDTTTSTTASTPVTPTPKPQGGICWEKPNGYKVAYPNDCSKYIVCNTPIPTGYYCPAGLQFSSEAQTCVQPQESDCGLITTTAEPPLPTMPWNECTGKPDYTLLPYEANCSLFIVCIKNLEHKAYCPAGQYFDVIQGNCSAQAHSDSCIYDYDTTTTEITTSTAVTTTPTTSTTPTTPKPNLGPCYGQADGTKVPYPNNCSKYIVCHDPIPVATECPEGLEFNSDLGECVRPEIANCSIKTTTEPPTTTTTTASTTTEVTTPKPPNVCANQPSGTTITYPSDCSKYYMCLNGNPTLVNCMPNSYYNPSSGQCDSSSPTICQAQSPCDGKENGYTYSYSQDCSKFYICLNDKPYLTQCPSSSYYNPAQGVCDPQTSESECQGDQNTTTEMPITTIGTSSELPTTTSEMPTQEVPTTTIELPTSTTEITSTETTTELPNTTTELPTTETTTELPTSTTELPTTPTTVTTTTTATTSTTELTTPTTTESNPPSQNQGNICCGQEIGTLLPYPGDNTKYVVCLYPVPEVAQCLANSTYDPETQRCQAQDDGYVSMPSCATVPFGQGLPYEGDCTKYYQCFGTMAKIMTCGNGWYFNAQLGSCVPAELYNCPWDM